MTIKEVEEKTGLARSNIRFYEKEKLIAPLRNETNGYRLYSEQDVSDIKKIAYLRTLGLSIEDIKKIQNKDISLSQLIERQAHTLESQISDLNQAKIMCEKMLKQQEISYEELRVEDFVSSLEEHWKENRSIFKLDSVRFLFIWGGTITWSILTALCLLLTILSFGGLPEQIPIQWNNGSVSSLADKHFIFAYPAACVIIRFLLRPFIVRWRRLPPPNEETIADYLTNYVCFTVLSVEVFTILYIHGMVKHVTTLLFIDTAVLLGLLAIGWYKLSFHDSRRNF